jgi:hypothetical protein
MRLLNTFRNLTAQILLRGMRLIGVAGSGFVLLSMLGSLSTPVHAQQYSTGISRLGEADSVSNILDQVKDLRHTSFSQEHDSLRQALNVVEAYRQWAYRKPVYHWSLARSQRITNAEHRAEAELMAGFLTGAILQNHIDTGSGVLPLLDASIAHLDSARVYYHQVANFMVSQSTGRIETDATIAEMLADSLNQLRTQLIQASNYNLIRRFSMAKLFEQTLRKKQAPASPIPPNSVTFWVMEAVHPSKLQATPAD